VVGSQKRLPAMISNPDYEASDLSGHSVLSISGLIPDH
jgi:hypothetical protein